MQTAEIKRRFLGYFERTGHVIVPSAPLPFDDPNLLFVNAGMVQFVPYFIGQVAAPWERATSVQKCIRTQDIEEVGKTTRHGTFFQMNGNFSFGDYFKEGAIKHAWALSTSSLDDGGFGLDPERIWPTVYLDDDEAFDIWQRVIGVPAERIVRRGKEDNTWDMGIPGPAGTCSELFYDRGPDYGPEGGPAVDEDRFMEYWNLVFMQYERGQATSPHKGDYEILGDLPKKNIDTGMGMERMATLLQGVDNMYEIDEMRPILDRAAALSNKNYGVNSGHAASQSDPDDVRLRVIADHTRTAIMLIGDGVTPSNEGRGYVLRRILRRTMRSMRQLGYEDRALPELLPVARDCMSPSYPELATDFGRIEMIAYAEEETFRRTLAAGTTILDTSIASAKAAGSTTLPGPQAFALHDTYGFPIELTLEMAAEQGLSVDEDGFRRLMAEQRQRSQADSKGNKAAHANNPVFRELRAQGPTEFLAYTNLTTESTVLGLVHRRRRRRRGGRGADGRRRARPHPVLRRVRRPDRRRGPDPGRERSAAAGAGRAAPGQGPDRAPGRRRGRRAQRGRDGQRRGRPGVAHVRAPGPLGHPRRARGAAAGARAVGAAERFLQQARLPASGLRLGLGSGPGPARRYRGRGQPGAAPRPAGRGALHVVGRGPRRRRAGAVRRDLRRGGPRRRHRRGVVARAVRWHPRRPRVADRCHHACWGSPRSAPACVVWRPTSGSRRCASWPRNGRWSTSSATP